MNARLRAVVADDHAIFLHAVVSVLEDGGIDVVAVANDGAEAVDAVFRTVPDVLVADLDMPKLDGIRVASTVLERHPDVRVVCLTALDDEGLREAALRAGAASCLVKGAPGPEFLAAVRGVDPP